MRCVHVDFGKVGGAGIGGRVLRLAVQRYVYISQLQVAHMSQFAELDSACVCVCARRDAAQLLRASLWMMLL